MLRALVCAPLLAQLLAGLTGCGSSPTRSPLSGPQGSAASDSPSARLTDRDGPGDNPPANLMAVPDAEPRLERVRLGGPNKPYEVLGQSYVPLQGDPPLLEHGLASWYGRKFHGRATSTGERYDMYAMSAAHPTMPLPSYARVRNPANGREVVVRVNDRGPFHHGRVIDLSYTAALKLDLLKGVAAVEVERITNEAIRSGSWRQPGAGAGDTTTASSTAPVAWPTAALALAAPAAAVSPAPARTAGATGTTTIATTTTPATVPDAVLLAAAAGVSDAPVANVAARPPAGAVARPVADAPPGYWLQLGAFSLADGAASFSQQVAQRLAWLAPLLNVFSDARLHRLQAGPYASRSEALQVAERLRQDLQLLPALVERR